MFSKALPVTACPHRTRLRGVQGPSILATRMHGSPADHPIGRELGEVTDPGQKGSVRAQGWALGT